jgi:hypothetical protein
MRGSNAVRKDRWRPKPGEVVYFKYKFKGRLINSIGYVRRANSDRTFNIHSVAGTDYDNVLRRHIYGKVEEGVMFRKIRETKP